MYIYVTFLPYQILMTDFFMDVHKIDFFIKKFLHKTFQFSSILNVSAIYFEIQSPLKLNLK